MADTNLTSISGALKQVYGDYVAKQQNLSHRSIDEIAKSAKKYNAGGQGFYGAINAYGNESIGAINEEENFRTIDAEQYLQYKVTPKVNVAPVQFSGLVAKAADQDEEAFVSAVVDALDMAKERLMKDRNRQFFGLGTGLLGTPNGVVASNATSFSVNSAQYFRDNQVIDIFNASTKTVDSLRISSVDKAAGVLYFATSVGVALSSTMQIVKENIRDSAPADGKEMMGLRGIVDDGTDLTTFQNQDASAQRFWRSIRIDASSANLTSDLMQRLLDDVAIFGGKEPDTFIMHRKQRRKYLDIVVPEKRYMEQKLDAGFQKLSFNGYELLLDEDCQDDTVYCVTKSMLYKFEVAPLAMGGYDGSDQFLRAINQDVYQAFWRVYDNLGTDKRNAHGKIVNLAKPTGIS
jgi:hypothetical protein